MLDAWRRVRASVPHARLLIAPRRPERSRRWPISWRAAACRAPAVHSSRRPPLADGDVLMLDTMGELPERLLPRRRGFRGRKPGGRGGHNVLEPAVAGKAVIVGPHMENFQEMADAFRAADALVQVARRRPGRRRDPRPSRTRPGPRDRGEARAAVGDREGAAAATARSAGGVAPMTVLLRALGPLTAPPPPCAARCSKPAAFVARACAHP